MFNIFKRRKTSEERRVKYQKKKREKYSLKWKRYFQALKKKVFRKRKPVQSPLYPYEELIIDS